MSFPIIEKVGIERGIERDIKDVVGFEKMTKRQKEVLSLMLDNETTTYEEMKQDLGITTDRGLSKHIENLKIIGAIERTQDYGGKWIVIFNNNKDA